MILGFDLTNPLVCEGIIGDGCGGGRIFIVKDKTLIAHDPDTKIDMILLKEIYNPISISKKGCMIYIKCEKEEINFDLSALKKV